MNGAETDARSNGDTSYDTFDRNANGSSGPDNSSLVIAKIDNTDDRLVKLGLLALTTPGVKFFKSAQSSFQEYLMHDPRIMMSATTYGFMLTLISMPIVPLVGGVILDCNFRNDSGGDANFNSPREKDDNDNDNDNDKPPTHGSGSLVMSLRSITGSVRNGNRPTAVHSMASQSYSLVGFLGLAVLGIIVYGIGLASPWVSSGLAIPIGLAGVTIFGIGEGCIMVAARAFVGRIFLGGDGAFAQGVVIAANNASMMFSKNLVPWLIETHKPEADNAASIRPGVLACLAVQAVGLLAGLLYTRLCVGDAQKPPAAAAAQTDEEEQHLLLPSKDDNDDVRQQQPSMASIKAERDRELAIINERNPIQQCTPSGIRMVVDLPLTFWVVAIGRAIFLVTFKVFSRFSNSFLIEKLNVGAVRAGRLSSVNELFALFSPLTGYLAYRSPGGIVFFAVGAALLGTFSIGSLALLPADGITGMPGGLLTPLVGISIAHGIIVPIALALVPHTVSSDQMGMAFAVVEVLGNTLNMTDILFGYLRDRAGNYDAPMKLLLAYASVGTVLLWMARKRILAIGIGRQGR